MVLRVFRLVSTYTEGASGVQEGMRGGANRPFVTTSEAARLAGITPQGMRLWYHRYPGLAHRVGGRWRVDTSALSNILNGTPLDGAGDIQHVGRDKGKAA